MIGIAARMDNIVRHDLSLLLVSLIEKCLSCDMWYQWWLMLSCLYCEDLPLRRLADIKIILPAQTPASPAKVRGPTYSDKTPISLRYVCMYSISNIYNNDNDNDDIER